MPASIFEPENIASLAAYVEATLKLYDNPNPMATPLQLGRCQEIGYTDPSGGVQGITTGSVVGAGWARSAPSAASAASWMGDVPGLPLCQNSPDNPPAGKFCSLCAPQTACPGCSANTVVVSLFPLPQDH